MGDIVLRLSHTRHAFSCCVALGGSTKCSNIPQQIQNRLSSSSFNTLLLYILIYFYSYTLCGAAMLLTVLNIFVHFRAYNRVSVCTKKVNSCNYWLQLDN